MDKFICKEVELGATMGPFFHNPLHSYLYTSPLNTAPKKGSTEGDRRVILDLSWPDGFAVNDGIDKNYYLGEWVSLRYPSIDDFTDLIASLGQGCLLYKRDLSRAYRQIPVCPGDIGFLGYSWRSRFYIDTALPFGLRSAAFICQRVTNAIAHLHRWNGYNLINYLDDFGGVKKPSKANEAFAQLGTLLSDLGVQEATQKAEAPSTNMEFLGIHLDTVSMTMSIPSQKMSEIRDILQVWSEKKRASKLDVQSLVGKLQFASRCIRQGRVFIARMLRHLRSLHELPQKRRVALPHFFIKDVCWWRKFMDEYNGISLILQSQWSQPDAIFSTDSCLSGCGGILNIHQRYFHSIFPNFILDMKLDINSLELLAMVVAFKLWGSLLRGYRVQVCCDNAASVAVVNSGRSM